mmetsp:Transcript_21804/g.62527  ORF Transcript_21804/g.62527 Transcript_21804/m.62527 type:complete len:248 (+) Transcript_21804:179-922(+)
MRRRRVPEASGRGRSRRRTLTEKVAMGRFPTHRPKFPRRSRPPVPLAPRETTAADPATAVQPTMTARRRPLALAMTPTRRRRKARPRAPKPLLPLAPHLRHSRRRPPRLRLPLRLRSGLTGPPSPSLRAPPLPRACPRRGRSPLRSPLPLRPCRRKQSSRSGSASALSTSAGSSARAEKWSETCRPDRDAGSISTKAAPTRSSPTAGPGPRSILPRISLQSSASRRGSRKICRWERPSARSSSFRLR